MLRWLLTLMAFFLIAFLACDDEEFMTSTGPKEVARVYFSNSAYNINFQEERRTSLNRILAKMDNQLGPGIRVEIHDPNDNFLLLEFPNATQNGVYMGRVRYINAAENRTYATTGVDMQNVTIFWRENFEISEFYFNGPSVRLLSGNRQLYIDSLTVQALREDGQ